MSKAFTYMIVISTMMVLLSIYGFASGTTSNILEALSFDDPSGFKIGELFAAIFNVFTISGVVSGIVVGYLFTQNPESALIAGATSLIGGWIVSDMVSLIVTFSPSYFGDSFGWIGTVIQAVLIIMLAGFVISIIQFWRGND